VRHSPLIALVLLVACGPQPSTTIPSTTPKIAREELAALFLSGDTKIVPSYATKRELARQHHDHVRHTVELCIDVEGVVDAVSVENLKLETYEAQIDARVRTWRYKPYMQDGVATPVCSSVDIDYSMEPGKYAPLDDVPPRN